MHTHEQAHPLTHMLPEAGGLHFLAPGPLEERVGGARGGAKNNPRKE